MVRSESSPDGAAPPAKRKGRSPSLVLLLAGLLLGLGFYVGWSARGLPWFAAAEPAPAGAAAERQQLLAAGWKEVDPGVFMRPCAGSCRRPKVFGGGAVEVLEVQCLDRPCGQIRATFQVLGADGAPLDSLVVSADGRQGERLQLVAETANPQARRLVLQTFSARARLD